MKHVSLLSLLVATAFLSACGTTETKAPVEDRSGTPTATAPKPVAPPSGSQVETHGLAPGSTDQSQSLGGDGVSGIEGVSAADAAKLKDANSPLSKRIVYFDFDKSAIKPDSRGLIEAHAQFLKEHGQAKVVLQGNTDERGSREYNMALGQRRADSVKQAMSVLGAKDDQMETISFGEEKPAAEGHDETAWKQNRRAEIHYKGE
jgi:peptidoglycan-associated lipoprotein